LAFIAPTDPDFRIASVDRATLERFQRVAEARSLATRWSSVEAMLSQVADGRILLHSLLREERGGQVRAYRCIIVFPLAGQMGRSGATTFDVDPEEYSSLRGIQLSAEGCTLAVKLFAMALDGIESVAKA